MKLVCFVSVVWQLEVKISFSSDEESLRAEEKNRRRSRSRSRRHESQFPVVPGKPMPPSQMTSEHHSWLSDDHSTGAKRLLFGFGLLV